MTTANVPLSADGEGTFLTNGPLRPAILRLALPAVGTTLFQVLFNVTDTFWVGRILGPDALAAVSTAGYSVWIIVAIGELLSVGLTAVAARRHGERKPEMAAQAAGTALVLAAVFGLIVAIAGWLGSDAIFAVMRTSAPVTELGTRFLHVQLAGAVLIYGYFVVDAAFRASGDTRTSFVLLGSCVLLNMALDPLMITGWGPLPELGIYGAALTGILTRALGLVIGLWLLARRKGIRPGFQWPVALTIARVGLPTMLTGVLFSAIYIVLVSIVSAYGTPALAGLGIGHKVEGVSYMMSVGFALAAATLVGQNLGAQQPGRAREAGWTTLRLALVPAVALSLCFVLIPDTLAGVFTRDPVVIAYAGAYIASVGVVQVALAFEVILESACGGAGYTFWPMFWIVGLSALRIPLAYWASIRWGLPGIWWILAGTMLIRGVAMGILWNWGKWERARA